VDEHRPTDEPLVIPLQLPRRQMRRLVGITVLLPVGAVAIFATDPSSTNALYGGLAILFLAVIWAVLLLGRGGRQELVATHTGISSPKFSLDWDRVAELRIGPLSGLAGGHLALWIEPREPSDIHWAESKVLERLGMTRAASIRIPAQNVDRPLEQLVAQLETQAGRPLLARS
jgi:hypothetical protein